MSVVALIPAAGASSRMRGADKLMEEVDGLPLLRRQVLRAREVCDRVIVALPPEPHARHAALDGLDVTPVVLPESAEGLSGTLRGLVGALPGDTDAFLLLLPDIPDLDVAQMRAVLSARAAKPDALIWRGATDAMRPGHPAVFARPTFAAFAGVSGDDGGQAVVRAFADAVHLVPLPGDLARRDLDTPEDWAEWRAGRGEPGAIAPARRRP